MADYLVFFPVVLIAIRTFGYGIFTISEKNVLGGIFIILLSLFVTGLSVYLLIFDRT